MKVDCKMTTGLELKIDAFTPSSKTGRPGYPEQFRKLLQEINIRLIFDRISWNSRIIGLTSRAM